MDRISILLAFALVFSTLTNAFAADPEWFSCTGMTEPLMLESETAVLFVHNTTISISPKGYDGLPMTDNYVGLGLRGLQEWLTDSGATCAEPDYPHTPGTRNGNRVAYTLFEMSDLECSWTRIDGLLPNGAQSETLKINMRNTSYPDFQLTLNATLAHDYYNYSYGSANTTGDIEYMVQYRPTSFKVNFQIDNFPFTAPTNDSHLVGYISGAVTINHDKFNLSFHQDPQLFRISAITLDQKLSFTEELDRGFLIDEVPYMNALNHAPFGPFTFPKGTSIGGSTGLLESSFAFCHRYPPGFRPKVIFWDPHLSTIFEISTPTDGPSPPSKSKKFPVAVVASVVPIVIVLVAAFIVIYQFSPSMQKVFQPFKSHHRVKDEKIIQNRWKAVRDPNQPALQT